jgi:hypothetical protein
VIQILFPSWTIAISAISAAFLTACTTAISTVQPADTVPKGHWHVSGGIDVAIPVSRIVDVLDAAIDLEEKLRDDPGYEPSDEELEGYAEAAFALALSPPGTGLDFMLRYGLADHLDAGLRYTPTGVHIDAKWQFLRSDAGGWDGALSVGYAYHLFDGLLFDVLELLRIDDFSRHDVEIPIIFGKKHRFGRIWLGPKAIIAFVSIDATLELADESLTTEDVMYYLGGFGGLSLGFRGFEAFAELTVMDLVAEPTVLGAERDLGGVVIMPSVGVLGRF